MRDFTPEETARWLSTLDRRVASAAAWLETPDDNLVIIHSDYKVHWTLPGGLIDAGETPLDAVCREVNEEVGLAIPTEAFTFCAVASRYSENIGLSYQFIFRASVTHEQVAAITLQENEIEAMEIVSRDQVKSRDRVYAPAIIAWQENTLGYLEHLIGD